MICCAPMLKDVLRASRLVISPRTVIRLPTVACGVAGVRGELAGTAGGAAVDVLPSAAGAAALIVPGECAADAAGVVGRPQLDSASADMLANKPKIRERDMAYLLIVLTSQAQALF